MVPRLGFSLSCLLLILAGGVLDAQLVRKRVPESPFETVTIAYTANLRGLHTKNQTEAPASALVSLLAGLQREYKNLLLVDVGNFIGPTASSLLTDGRLDFAVMERLGYDLVHLSGDDFAIGKEKLGNRIAETKVPVLSGNLGDGLALDWTVVPVGNRKMGFVGVTSENFTKLVLATQRPGIGITPASEYLARAIEGLAGKADIVVALTDLDEPEMALIRDIPGLDLIVTTGGNVAKAGSDWISVGFPGMKRAAIARVLTTGTAVHVLELHGHPVENKWTIDEVIGEVYPVDKETPRDPDTDLWIDDQLESIRQANSRTRGYLWQPLHNVEGKRQQTPLGQAVADLMRSRTKAHLALLDAGALRKGLGVGPVNDWDLLETLPYPDEVVVVKLTGEQINAVIARAKLKVGEDGFLQTSNLTTVPKNLGNRIGGLKILPDRIYLVAMPEFLALGGTGYEEMVTAPVVERTGLTLADLSRQTILAYGTLVPERLPMDEESHFWYSQLHLSTTFNGFVADPETPRYYPEQVTLLGQQLIATSFTTKFVLNRVDGFSALENSLEAQYGLWWDQNWAPSQTLDKLTMSSQLTLQMSNILFGGDRIADPYVSGLLETALVYPDPTGIMFVNGLTRPGKLQLRVGLAAPTLLRPLSLQGGLRWENHPFAQGATPKVGLDGVVALRADLIEDLLTLNSSTEVFAPLELPYQGVTILSVNEVLFTLKTNLSIGPRIQLFYNSLVGHWSYLFDTSFLLDLTFQ